MIQTRTIDRRFAGVGRIKKASGTVNPALVRKLNRMLTELYDTGRLDVLRAIHDGSVLLLAAYDAYRRKVLDQLPLGETLRPLSECMAEWIAVYDCSDHHRISLGTSRGYLIEQAPRATVAELPAILDSLRATLGRKHPRSFNLARAAALAFVRSTLKRSHPLWLQVAAVEPVKVVRAPARRAITPAEFRALFPSPMTDVVDAAAWSIVTTGMRINEYWGRWSVASDRVKVAGTKTAGSVRFVPLVWHPTAPQLHHRTWENAVRKRSDRTIRPYDVRRTYAAWLEESGVPRTRRMMYLGHGARDVTDLYERQEIEAFLVEDAGKVRAFLGLGEPISLKLVRHS